MAVHPAGILDEFDHLAVPKSICITDALLQDHRIGHGEEVFIVGLFRHHAGTQKNIPIVRIGNLAARGEEKIVTSTGERDAFLIEARSIGGLSGSPVFFNLGSVRVFDGQIRTATSSGPLVFLCGLIHGHYDVNNSNLDEANEDTSLTTEKVNTGIAIITPIHKAVETIDHHIQKNTPNFSLNA